MENFKKLFNSIKFRFASVFSFEKSIPFFVSLCKVILLIIFGLPFCAVELLGIFFAMCSCLPIVGTILNFTVCLMCDLLASLFFYLIMLPNIIFAKKEKQHYNAPKEQNDVAFSSTNRKIYLTMSIKKELVSLLNIISTSYLGEDAVKIRSFIILCMLSEDISYCAILNFSMFLKSLDNATPEDLRTEEMKEAIDILNELL